MNQMRGLIGQEDEENRSLDEFNKQCTLSYRSRLIGFGIFMSIGVILSIVAAFMVFDIASNPAKFAVPYTLGTICSLLSTIFLWGPMKQLKAMFDKTRIFTTIFLIVSIIATLIAAFVSGNPAAVIICVIVQCIAFIWYGISFIPFARTAILKCCKSTVSL
jgi:Na+/melibiose symporter-like transporter